VSKHAIFILILLDITGKGFFNPDSLSLRSSSSVASHDFVREPFCPVIARAVMTIAPSGLLLDDIATHAHKLDHGMGSYI